MQKTNSGPEAKAELEKLDAIKKRAARQAAKRELAPEVQPAVECTVLPMGDGKISMGEHFGGLGTAHYEEGETFSVELPIAVSLYERGFINFPGARDALSALTERREDDRVREQAAKQKLDKLLESAA